MKGRSVTLSGLVGCFFFKQKFLSQEFGISSELTHSHTRTQSSGRSLVSHGARRYDRGGFSNILDEWTRGARQIGHRRVNFAPEVRRTSFREFRTARRTRDNPEHLED